MARGEAVPCVFPDALFFMKSLVEREALAILVYLEKHGYTTLHDIARETGVSFANVQRYLNSYCWEIAPRLKTAPGTPREQQEAWLTTTRKVNPSLYWRYVPSLRPGKDGLFRINRSKRDLLQFYAHLYHYELCPSKEYPGFMVRRNSSARGVFGYNGQDQDRYAFDSTEPLAIISTTR